MTLANCFNPFMLHSPNDILFLSSIMLGYEKMVVSTLLLMILVLFFNAFDEQPFLCLPPWFHLFAMTFNIKFSFFNFVRMGVIQMTFGMLTFCFVQIATLFCVSFSLLNLYICFCFTCFFSSLVFFHINNKYGAHRCA